MMIRRPAALLAASLATVTSPSFAQQPVVEGDSCRVLSLSVREPSMGKDAIAILWRTMQYVVDPRVDVNNSQTAQQQTDAQVVELNDRAGYLSSEIAKKRKMHGGIGSLSRRSAPPEESAKVKDALSSLDSDIAKDEARLHEHNQTSTYYIQAYCKDDAEKGYEAGSYRPRLLGRAVRDAAGRFQFRPGEQ